MNSLETRRARLELSTSIATLCGRMVVYAAYYMYIRSGRGLFAIPP
jgi:hypothetical protein